MKTIKELINKYQKEIEAEAIRCYPSECCGFITSSETQDEFFPCENLQDKMHAYDPETFTRDSKTAYYISPKVIMDVMKNGETSGKKIRVIYHSHPDHDAYFSDEDQQAATYEKEPVYPGIDYHVVSVYNGKIKAHETFCWNPQEHKFTE